MTSRIHRGFHRIGVVLLDGALVAGSQIKSAVPLLVVTVALYAAARVRSGGCSLGSWDRIRYNVFTLSRGSVST